MSVFLDGITSITARKKKALITVGTPKHDNYHPFHDEAIPMDLVVVLDRSKSMKSFWGDVLDTLFMFISQMSKSDRLAIRTFAGARRTSVIQELKFMTPLNKKAAYDLLQTIESPRSGHTNLGAAVADGLDELILARTPRYKEARLLLFTDGKPSAGEITTTQQFVALRDQKMSRLGANAKLAVVAFGKRHDAHLLKALTSEHSSLYYPVNTENLEKSVAKFYAGVRTTCARNITLKISCAKGCQIMTTFPTKRISVTAWVVKFPDLQFSEKRHVVVEMPLSTESVHCRLSFHSVRTTEKKYATLSLNFVNPQDSDREDIDARAAINVDEQERRVEAVFAMDAAISKARNLEYKAARKRLEYQKTRLDTSISAHRPLIRNVSDTFSVYASHMKEHHRDLKSGGKGRFSNISEMSATADSWRNERNSSTNCSAYYTPEEESHSEYIKSIKEGPTAEKSGPVDHTNDSGREEAFQMAQAEYAEFGKVVQKLYHSRKRSSREGATGNTKRKIFVNEWELDLLPSDGLEAIREKLRSYGEPLCVMYNGRALTNDFDFSVLATGDHLHAVFAITQEFEDTQGSATLESASSASDSEGTIDEEISEESLSDSDDDDLSIIPDDKRQLLLHKMRKNRKEDSLEADPTLKSEKPGKLFGLLHGSPLRPAQRSVNQGVGMPDEYDMNELGVVDLPSGSSVESPSSSRIEPLRASPSLGPTERKMEVADFVVEKPQSSIASPVNRSPHPRPMPQRASPTLFENFSRPVTTIRQLFVTSNISGDKVKLIVLSDDFATYADLIRVLEAKFQATVEQVFMLAKQHRVDIEDDDDVRGLIQGNTLYINCTT